LTRILLIINGLGLRSLIQELVVKAN